jgi:hypothetical protein
VSVTPLFKYDANVVLTIESITENDDEIDSDELISPVKGEDNGSHIHTTKSVKHINGSLAKDGASCKMFANGMYNSESNIRMSATKPDATMCVKPSNFNFIVHLFAFFAICPYHLD